MGDTIIQSITVQYPVLKAHRASLLEVAIKLANDLWNICLIFEKLLIYVTFSPVNYISDC